MQCRCYATSAKTSSSVFRIEWFTSLYLSLSLFLSLFYYSFIYTFIVTIQCTWIDPYKISTGENYFVEQRKERRHTADAVKMSKKIQLLIARRRRRDTHTRTRLIIIITKPNKTDRHRHRCCDDVYYTKYAIKRSSFHWKCSLQRFFLVLHFFYSFLVRKVLCVCTSWFASFFLIHSLS